MTESAGNRASVELMRSPRLQAITRYWHAKRGDRTMPARRDIDPVEIPGLLPIVMMADARALPVRITLLGSEATALYGREMRDCAIEAFDLGRSTPAWRDAIVLVTRSCQPTAVRGFLGDGVQSFIVEAVLLPLSDDDGRLAHIFGGLQFDRQQFDSAPARKPMVRALADHRTLADELTPDPVRLQRRCAR